MEIVCQAWYPKADTLIEAIPMLADQGVTAIEISVNNVQYFDYRNAFELDKLMSRLQSSGIRAHSVHSPFGQGYDISSPNDEVHERGVDALIDAIEIASVIGASKVIVHPSDVLHNCRNRRLERARGVIREVSTIASESGVVLAVENLPPDYLGHTKEELFALVEGIDPHLVGFCFDSGHANLSDDFVGLAEALLPHAFTTHLHDNDGKNDQHRFPGEGTINWRQFAQAYKKARSSASIMLECVPPANVLWSEAFQRLRLTMGN